MLSTMLGQLVVGAVIFLRPVSTLVKQVAKLREPCGSRLRWKKCGRWKWKGITEPEQVGWSRARLSSKRAELPVRNTSFGKHNYTTFTRFHIKSLVPVDTRSVCHTFPPLQYVMNVLNTWVVPKTFMKCAVRDRVTLYVHNGCFFRTFFWFNHW